MLYNYFVCHVFILATVFVHDESVRSSSKLAIGLGVGGGVVLLVAIVLCILGITYYRR